MAPIPEEQQQTAVLLFEVPRPELGILGVRVCRRCQCLVPFDRVVEHISWHDDLGRILSWVLR